MSLDKPLTPDSMLIRRTVHSEIETFLSSTNFVSYVRIQRTHNCILKWFFIVDTHTTRLSLYISNIE